MPGADDKTIWSACSQCGGSRHHDILKEVIVRNDEDYQDKTSYRIIRCRGCHQTSYRTDYEDFEQATPNPYAADDWDIPTTITLYPKYLEGHKKLDGDWMIPGDVRKIYEQTISAIEEDARILAGLGLRGTIEAVCNDRSISGRDLEKRIGGLATAGLISKKDADRLHAIRFLGNDAAHEIKEPAESQVVVALKIVEHLLNSVYILDNQTSIALDTIISTFEDLAPVIINETKKMPLGEEVSFVRLLGGQYRRIKENAPQLEVEFQNNVSNGYFVNIEIGKSAIVGNSTNPIQQYKIK